MLVIRRTVGPLAAAALIFVALFSARGLDASSRSITHCLSHAHTSSSRAAGTRDCGDDDATLHVAAAATFSSGPTVDVQASIRPAAPFSRPVSAGRLHARLFTARPHDPDHLHAYALLI